LLIGERTAEELKINIGTASPRSKSIKMDCRGRDLITGLPKSITVTSEEMLDALNEPVNSICDAVHSVLEKTPPELASDISARGIVMTGGGSLLHGLNKLLEKRTGIPTYIAEDAVYGSGISIFIGLPLLIMMNFPMMFWNNELYGYWYTLGIFILYAIVLILLWRLIGFLKISQGVEINNNKIRGKYESMGFKCKFKRCGA